MRANEGNFKIFKNHQGDLSQKLHEPNMWLLVNHTKPRNTLYWNWHLLTAGNYKSASRQLENSWLLQNNTVKSAMLKTTNCVINQVIYYFLTHCFTFLTKFWMLQVRKSHSCGISAIIFQCCFMIETQVLMTVSDFFKFFFQESFHGRELHFSIGGGGGVFFRWRGSFLSWGHQFWWGGGGFEKVKQLPVTGIQPPPTLLNNPSALLSNKGGLSLKQKTFFKNNMIQFFILHK